MRSSRILIAATSWALALAFPWSFSAHAHSPHDDVFDVKASPDFARDQSVYAIVRSNFMLSRDGGKTWKRIVNGLDHKHLLYAFDVADDGETLYLTSLGDGVYRSTDAGTSWQRASTGLTDKAIELVAIAPNSADQVLVAGAEGRLARTIDAGRSWQEVVGDFGKVTAVAFNPGNGAQVFVGDSEGAVYRSEDGGATWSLRYASEGGAAPITSLAVDVDTSGASLILFGTADGRIGRSDDGGERFAVGWEFPSREAVLSIGMSPQPSRRMAYAVLWDEGVYCSSDDGATWATCAQGLTRDRQSKQLGRPSFSEIAVADSSAGDPTLFVAGYDGLFKSNDGGRTWHQLDTLSTTNIVGLAVSPEYGEDSTVVVTNWLWGAHGTRDQGASWQAMNNGAHDYVRPNGLTRLFNVVYSPDFQNDRTLFTSTWYRLLKSTDGGESWRQIAAVDNEDWSYHGLVIAISPDFENDGTVYIGTHRGALLKSTDRGESFQPLKNTNTIIGGLVVASDGPDGQTVFAGDSHGIHRSRDGGTSWDFTPLVDDDLHHEIASPAALTGEVAQTWVAEQYSKRRKALAIKLAASPNYATDHTLFAATPNGLFKTDDRGDNWRRLQIEQLDGDAYIEGVAVSPDFANDGTLLVSVRGHGHFRSVDGGLSFKRIAEQMIDDQVSFAHFVGMTPKFPSMVFSPNYAVDKTIYAYSGGSLFRSTDAGDHWDQVSAPEPSWFDKTYVDARYISSRLSWRRFFRSKKLWALVIAIAGLSFIALNWRRRRRRAKI